MLDLSPDGNRLAVHVGDITDYVLIHDIEEGNGRRLSADESQGYPIWHPDGLRMLVSVLAPSRMLVGNAGQDDRFDEFLGEGWLYGSWHPNGEVIAVERATSPNLIAFASAGEDPVLTNIEGFPFGFSPDGGWFAYTSPSEEIWVASYPNGLDKWLMSDRGVETRWCACGELFYRDGNRWFASAITTDPEFTFRPPVPVFETDFIDTPGVSYAVSADGQELYVVKRAEPEIRSRLRVVTNWSQPLRETVVEP